MREQIQKFQIGDNVKPLIRGENEFTVTQVALEKGVFKYSAHMRRWFEEQELTLVKPKKKITLYRYTLKFNGEEEYSLTNWTSNPNANYHNCKKIRTETKEIEVDA